MPYFYTRLCKTSIIWIYLGLFAPPEELPFEALWNEIKHIHVYKYMLQETEVILDYRSAFLNANV